MLMNNNYRISLQSSAISVLYSPRRHLGLLATHSGGSTRPTCPTCPTSARIVNLLENHSTCCFRVSTRQPGEIDRGLGTLAAGPLKSCFKPMSENTESNDNSVRIERDSLGEIAVPAHRLWGAQTQRSVENFNIGGSRELMPTEMIRALATIKLAAARVNVGAGKLTEKLGQAIIDAAEDVLGGNYMDHFPLVVWQTGSGTQSNMNMNEVISNIAIHKLGGEIGSKNPVHPNDHVNFGQSSNDVFPTAMHIASAIEITGKLLPSLENLAEKFSLKEKEFADIIKVGRTHLQDATPMTLGQEFSGFASIVRSCYKRIQQGVQSVFELAQGGTAVGTGLNCYEGFAEAFASEIARITHLPFVTAPNKFEALGGIGPMVELSSSISSTSADLLKIANDIRLLSSGPRSGLSELVLPSNEPGSSIMPGKVNPTQCEALSMVCAEVLGNHTTVSICSTHGHLQLNVFRPVVVLNVLRSIRLLTDAINGFGDRCVMGIKPNKMMIEKHLSNSLMLATALAPHIGYDNTAKTVLHAHRNNLSLLDAALQLGTIDKETFERVVRPETMTSCLPKDNK